MPLTQADQKKYKSLYLQTAKEYVYELSSNIKNLREKNQPQNAIETLHRAAHSLASQSIMMSFQSMSEISSVLEKIFEEKKNDNGSFSEEELIKLFDATTHMSACLDHIDKTEQEIDLSTDIKDLQKIA